MLNDSNNISTITSRNNELNQNILSLNDNLKKPFNFVDETDTKPEDFKKLLDIAKNNQKVHSKAHQDEDEKRIVLDKYSEVLKHITRLFDMMSFDFSDLSLEELTKKIDEHVNARNLTTNQITFSFYQDLFSSVTDRLLAIETSYQNGQLSAKEGLQRVQNLKSELTSNSKGLPKQMAPAYEELDFLISMYEGSFTDDLEQNASFGDILPPYTLSDQSKMRFDNLNTKTKELCGRAAGIFQDLSKFQPNVRLKELYTKIRLTDQYFKMPDWTVSDANIQVSDLQSTTTILFNEQQEKNHKRETFKTDITNLTSDFSKVNINTVQEISKKTFEETNERSTKAKNRADQIKILSDGNKSMTKNFADQYSKAIDTQLAVDDGNAMSVCSVEHTESSLYNQEENTNARDEIYHLHDYLIRLEQTRAPKLSYLQNGNPENQN